MAVSQNLAQSASLLDKNGELVLVTRRAADRLDLGIYRKSELSTLALAACQSAHPARRPHGTQNRAEALEAFQE